MDEFPDLRMSALAVLFQTKWNSRANKPNDFFVKEALTTFASSLKDDDIGYLYDPKSPLEICTNPGELVGKIANSRLPYNFNFTTGIEHFVTILKAIDGDYKRIGIIISDCFTPQIAEVISQIAIDDVTLYVFNIGRTHFDGMINMKDVKELEGKLSELQK